ncbi:hypothetical protein HMPREF0262_00952 [Clostridium sp. ATCC 29733]|nr:hypothetical protein HMPREF0262_00952 [Clostridium sp. ATCC 29733]
MTGQLMEADQFATSWQQQTAVFKLSTSQMEVFPVPETKALKWQRESIYSL